MKETFEEYLSDIPQYRAYDRINISDEFDSPENLRKIADELEIVLSSGQYEQVYYDRGDDCSDPVWIGVRNETEQERILRAMENWDYLQKQNLAEARKKSIINDVLARRPDLEYSTERPFIRKRAKDPCVVLSHADIGIKTVVNGEPIDGWFYKKGTDIAVYDV